MSAPFLRRLLLALCLLTAARLTAQTAINWNYAGTDFATAANWTGGAVPTSNLTTHRAAFAGTTFSNQPNLAANRSIGGIEVTAAAANDVSLNGTATLTLGAYGLRNNSTAARLDVYANLALGAASNFVSSQFSFVSGNLDLSTFTLTTSGTGTASIGGVISGTGGITVNHTSLGTTNLYGINTYTGNTTLTAGILSYNAGSALSTGTLVVNGGWLSNNATATVTNNVTVGGNAQISGNYGGQTFSGAITLTGNRTLTTDGLVTFSGAVGQSAAGYGLTKAGTGNLVLNAASTNTGATTVTGGTLLLGASGTISSANLTLNGGVLGQQGTFSRNFGTGASQVQLGASGGGFAAYGGALTISGFTGTPTWGTTAGFFTAGGSLLFGSSVANNVVTWTNNFSLGTATRTISLTDNTTTTADKAVISGVISGTGGLTVTGSGLLELTGANTYSGTTTLSGGTIATTGSGTLGTGNLTLNGGVLAQSGTFSRALGTGAGQVQFSGGGGGFAAYGGPLTITGFTGTPVWGTTAGFNVGTLYLSSNQADNVVTWTNDFSLGASTRNILVEDNTTSTADHAVISGAISGTGGLFKISTGLLVLEGINSFSGGVTVSGGQVRAANATALGTGTVALSGSGTSLTLAGDSGIAFGNNTAVSNTATITSDRLTAGAGVNHTLGNLTIGANSLTIGRGANATSGTAGLQFGAVTLTGNATFSVNTGTLLTVGSVTGSGRNLFLSATGDAVVSGSFDTGSGTLTKTGVGTLSLNGASTRTGTNTLNGGTLELGHDSALGSGALSIGSTTTTLRGANGARTLANNVTFTTGTTLGGASDLTLTGTLTNVNNNTLNVTNTGTTAFTGAFNLSSTATSRTLTVNNTGALVFSGIIANGSTSTAGALIKNGTGTLTLAGANTYAGNTSINAGTLNLTGSLANSALTTIASGATLTGAGSLGDLMLAGTYAPGNSPALISVGDFTIGSTGLLQMEIGGLDRGTGYDAFDINGIFATGGTLDVSFINGFTPTAAATFNLFNFTSLAGTFGTVTLPTLAGGYAWDSSALYTDGELKITYTAVPEPSTYAVLAGLGALGLALWRRRQARPAVRA